MAIRLEKISNEFSSNEAPRTKRLRSIISTCEIAESVISFVVELTKSKVPEDYPQVIKQLPKTLQLLSSGVVPMANITDQVKKSLTSKLKGGLERLSGEVTK